MKNRDALLIYFFIKHKLLQHEDIDIHISKKISISFTTNDMLHVYFKNLKDDEFLLHISYVHWFIFLSLIYYNDIYDLFYSKIRSRSKNLIRCWKLKGLVEA